MSEVSTPAIADRPAELEAWLLANPDFGSIRVLAVTVWIDDNVETGGHGELTYGPPYFVVEVTLPDPPDDPGTWPREDLSKLRRAVSDWIVEKGLAVVPTFRFRPETPDFGEE